MGEESKVRFVLDEEKQATNFIYRPPQETKADMTQAQHATLGVKFAQGVYFLDPWGFMLLGKNRWQRALFRFKHPIVYSKRGLLQFFRKIKRLFIKDRMELCRPLPEEPND